MGGANCNDPGPAFRALATPILNNFVRLPQSMVYPYLFNHIFLQKYMA